MEQQNETGAQAQPVNQTAQDEAAAPEQQQQVRVGFEAALDEFFPEWRSTWGQPKINELRHFYMKGTKDVSLVVSNSMVNANGILSWIDQNAQTVKAG